MLETPFPFLISKKPGEIPIFGTFLAKKLIFFSILVYLHWKSAFWVQPCLKTSLWCHTLTDFHDFGINGKRRPYPIPWYQTIILWDRQVQVHKGGGVVNHVTKRGLVGRGLNGVFCTPSPHIENSWIRLWLAGLPDHALPVLNHRTNGALVKIMQQ